MDYNVLIGGAAGQGMETLSSLLEKILKRKGYEVFTVRDYMSRVRGGHNFIQIRFSNEALFSHKEELDAIIALNDETIDIHVERLADGGIIISDEDSKREFTSLLKLPLKSAAKKAGNIKAFGSVAIGAILKAFGLDLTSTKEVFDGWFKEEVSKQNYLAAEEGFGLLETKFKSLPKGAVGDKHIVINGNAAIAMGAMAAGVKFYSAYPMTPSTSIMTYIAERMEKAEIVVEQAEDEIAGINMAIGASYAGVRAMTGTSGGGFCLKVEAVGLSAMLEVPLVIANIQRPGPTTGLPTRTEQADLKFVIAASQGEFPRMVIALRHPEDAFYQTVRAFNLADKYQIPVILLGDQFLADYTKTIPEFDFSKVTIERYLSDDLYKGDKEYKRYEITESGISPRIIPGKDHKKSVLVDSDEHDEFGHIIESSEERIQMNDKRLRKMERIKEDLIEPDFLGDENCDTLLVAWGSLYGPVKEAVEMLNATGTEKYGALVFGDIWPLPVNKLEGYTKKAKKLINVEQNATGQLASVIMEVIGIRCDGSVLKYDGRPISSFEIVNRVKEGK